VALRFLSLSKSLVLVVVAALALSLACGLANGPVAGADDRLQFTGTTISGAPFNGATLAGKPVVMFFWASWCPFSNAGAPAVSQVAASNPKVTFVGIAGRSDAGSMHDFVTKYNMNFTNLNDADGSLWARFNVPWQPAYLFYRPDGSYSFVNNPTQAMSEQELAQRVTSLSI
jgi:thiol-disulfide isomerase/thioredoxin